jgi:hypothetical protein
VTRESRAGLPRPVQVWLPRLSSSLGRPEIARDAQRAFAAWRGDLKVWLSPDFRQEARWQNGDFTEVAVPAEHIDELRVYHVGDNGRVFGPGSRQRFPNGRMDGLLEAWLNIGHLGGCKAVTAPDWIEFDFPTIHRKGVRYERTRISVEPGPTFPQSRDRKSGKIRVQWPPAGRAAAATPFPDGESLAHNPPLLDGRDEHGVPLIAYQDGTVAVQVVQEWPPPIATVMPLFSAFDDVTTQKRMAVIAAASAKDPEEALKAARLAAAPYVTDAYAPRDLTWLYPTHLESGPLPVLSRAEEVGVEGLRELYSRHERGQLTPELLSAFLARSRAWLEAMGETIEVRRTWGPLGLFWALLLNELEARRPFQGCERCGRVIRGKKDKRFCGPTDATECFRARRAKDQRRSRGQGK